VPWVRSYPSRVRKRPGQLLVLSLSNDESRLRYAGGFFVSGLLGRVAPWGRVAQKKPIGT